MNYSVSSFKVYIDKVNPDSWIIPRTRITPGNSCSGFITMLGQSIRTWKVIRNINRAMVGSWPYHLLSYLFC